MNLSDSTFQLSFRLDERLKGEPQQSTTSAYWVRTTKGEFTPGVSNGERFLMFLKPGK